MRRLWPVLLNWVLLVLLPLAWTSPAWTQPQLASAPSASPPAAPLPSVPYAGAPGALPVTVVLQYLGTRLGAQGRFDYRTLLIMQDSQPPAFDKATLTVIREAINDPVKRGLRLRFTLTREGETWTIGSLVEDFSCRNRPVWGTRPCP